VLHPLSAVSEKNQQLVITDELPICGHLNHCSNGWLWVGLNLSFWRLCFILSKVSDCAGIGNYSARNNEQSRKWFDCQTNSQYHRCLYCPF